MQIFQPSPLSKGGPSPIQVPFYILEWHTFNAFLLKFAIYNLVSFEQIWLELNSVKLGPRLFIAFPKDQIKQQFSKQDIRSILIFVFGVNLSAE